MKSHLSFEASKQTGSITRLKRQQHSPTTKTTSPFCKPTCQTKTASYSVLADATSDQAAVYLLTLALLYFRLTGPYWRLLGSKTHYLDFYKHVVQTKDQLDQWSQNARTIFSAELPPLFAQQLQDCASFRAAIQVAQTTKQQIISIYQSLCGHLSTVVDLQPSDFCLRDTTMQSLIQQCDRSSPISR